MWDGIGILHPLFMQRLEPLEFLPTLTLYSPSHSTIIPQVYQHYDGNILWYQHYDILRMAFLFTSCLYKGVGGITIEIRDEKHLLGHAVCPVANTKCSWTSENIVNSL